MSLYQQEKREVPTTPDKESIRAILDEYRSIGGFPLRAAYSNEAIDDLAEHLATELASWLKATDEAESNEERMIDWAHAIMCNVGGGPESQSLAWCQGFTAWRKEAGYE